MKRRLFTILSAVSLLLFVAVCVLWMRSIFLDEVLMLRRGREEFIFYNMGGVVTLRWDTRPDEEESLLGIVHARPFDDFEIERAFAWDFDAGHERKLVSPNRAATTYRALRLPHWLPAIASLVSPTIWAWRFRRRRPTGLCPSCGYDLRATPWRCPECGHVATLPPP